MTQQVPSIGRVVMYQLPDGPNKGQFRPAFIVRVWSETTVNLQVFTDGTNDGDAYALGSVWRTSVTQGDAPGQWQWPVYVPPKVTPVEGGIETPADFLPKAL